MAFEMFMNASTANYDFQTKEYGVVKSWLSEGHGEDRASVPAQQIKSSITFASGEGKDAVHVCCLLSHPQPDTLGVNIILFIEQISSFSFGRCRPLCVPVFRIMSSAKKSSRPDSYSTTDNKYNLQ